MFDAYDVEWACPSHGNPIGSAHVDAYLETLSEVLAEQTRATAD